MPHGFYNLKFLTALGRVGLLAALLCGRAVVAEPSAGQLMQFPGFRNAVFTIAMVNKAMREAAENPMDEWRRRNVQIAVSMMPNAIRGLAGDYLNGNMSPEYFPMVQAMLGGFIDQAAPENYKKFLANPSRHNIPKTGSDFPVVAAPAVPAAPAGAPAPGGDKNMSTSVAVASGSPDAPAHPTTRPEELADLSDRVAVATSPEPQGKADSKNLGYDDGVQKSEAAAAGGVSYASVFGPVGAEAATPGTAASYQTPLVQEASRELSAIEAKVTPSNLTNILPARRDVSSKNSEKDSEDVFKSVGKDDKKKARSNRERVSGRGEDTASYALPTKPKFWRVTPLLNYVDKIVLNAQAEEGGQNKDGGKKDGGGAQAIAQILFGVAAIIAAIAPMVVASTQAKADIAIAKINADTQKELTQITSQTSKDLAQMQKDVALTQSAIAQQISQTNNAAVTDRLDRQLTELNNARTDARQAEKERRQLEDSYNQQRIQLAKQQADDNLKLAKETLKAQLTQAGLTSGYGSSTNSGATLTASSSLGVGSSGSVATAPTQARAVGDNSASLDATVTPPTVGSSKTVSGGGATSATVGNLISKSTTATTGSDGVPNLGLGGRKDDMVLASASVPGGSARLLQGLNGGVGVSSASANRRFDSVGDDEGDESEIDPRTGKAVSKNGRKSGRRSSTSTSGKRTSRRSAPVTSGRLNQLMTKPVTMGSTPDKKVTSDLQRFLSAGASGGPTSSFTQYRETSGRAPASAPVTVDSDRPVRTVAVGYTEGYNAPNGGHEPAAAAAAVPFEMPKFLTGPEAP